MKEKATLRPRTILSLLWLSCVPAVFGDVLPLANFTHSDFAGSANCAACHTGLRDEAGSDVSIDTHWRSTMMANSAKDPFWQAKVSSEVLRQPELQAVIEEKCATCHMPMARTQAQVLGVPVAISGDGFLNPGNALHAAAMDGVSCSLCHQVSDQLLGEPSSFSGGYVVDTSTSAPDRLIYGPFTEPFVRQMQNNLGFTPVHGSHVTSSALCATCHNLSTPFVDADGVILGEFPEQMTYSEWEHSQFNSSGAVGRQCQDCHMPAAEGGVKLSNRGGPGLSLPLRRPFGQHHFVGGNAFMVDLLTDNLEQLGISASSTQLSQTRSRTLSQMQSSTARLAVTMTRIAHGRMEVDLEVQSLVGHKFPSGFPSRRAWLHVTVTDALEQVVFESGRPDEEGRIAGNDSDFGVGNCEPHHELISAPDQVQVYESVMQNTDGEVTYTLLRGAAYRKDNRLLPPGFDQTSAGADIAVAGSAASDPDFVGGSDRIRYRIATGTRPGPFTISARLLYQSLAYSFAEDLWQGTTEAIDRFQTMHEAADLTPLTVASLVVAVDPNQAYQLRLFDREVDGRAVLAVYGPVGGENLLEGSLNLQDWQRVGLLKQTANPTFYEDMEAADLRWRFYRLRQP